MNDNCMLAFLNALKENNTKEWMSANKSWQKEANADFFLNFPPPAAPCRGDMM